VFIPTLTVAEGDDHALSCQGEKIHAFVGVLQKVEFLKKHFIALLFTLRNTIADV
jgi:hypothetical protein